MSNRSALHRLRKAITSETWCKGSMGLDTLGTRVETDSPNACKRCLWGWISYLKTPRDELLRAFMSLYPHRYGLMELNDASETTIEDIHELIDSAIVLCPK